MPPRGWFRRAAWRLGEKALAARASAASGVGLATGLPRCRLRLLGRGTQRLLWVCRGVGGVHLGASRTDGAAIGLVARAQNQ
eukprot:8073774-Pyramimonas_sp.AAC.1